MPEEEKQEAPSNHLAEMQLLGKHISCLVHLRDMIDYMEGDDSRKTFSYQCDIPGHPTGFFLQAPVEQDGQKLYREYGLTLTKMMIPPATLLHQATWKRETNTMLQALLLAAKHVEQEETAIVGELIELIHGPAEKAVFDAETKARAKKEWERFSDSWKPKLEDVAKKFEEEGEKEDV